jgi:hypothetical protein
MDNENICSVQFGTKLSETSRFELGIDGVNKIKGKLNNTYIAEW